MVQYDLSIELILCQSVMLSTCTETHYVSTRQDISTTSTTIYYKNWISHWQFRVA